MDGYSASGLAVAMRVRGRIKRTIVRAPVVKPWSDHNYRARLGRHAEKLPWIDKDRFDVVAEVRQNGVAVRDVHDTLPSNVLEAADSYIDGLRDVTVQKSTVDVVPDALATDPAVYKWGLTDENLDLAEYYIGLPVRYLGVGIKRESADGVAAHVRQWHRDIEDRRMLKIIVYMSDVGDGCGPIEYLDPTQSDRAAEFLSYESGFVTDNEMAQVVDKTSWNQVMAPRLTAIFVDPSRIFHRAQAPTMSDRYSMTFTYSSSTPLQTFPYMTRAAFTGLRNDLTARQRRAAFAE